MNSIIETDFQEGLKKEKKQIHRDIIAKWITKVHGPIDFYFSDNHTRKHDDNLEIVKKNYLMEYKIDYRAKKTGNLVFELITSIKEECYPNINGIRFTPKNKSTIVLMELIEKIKNNVIVGNISRHINESSEPYILCYAISNKNDANNTNTIKDIDEYIIFDGFKLSKFVSDNYKTSDLIVTKTNNWYTISMLMNLEESKKVCLKNIYIQDIV